jgi:hypothetical protein
LSWRTLGLTAAAPLAAIAVILRFPLSDFFKCDKLIGGYEKSQGNLTPLRGRKPEEGRLKKPNLSLIKQNKRI